MKNLKIKIDLKRVLGLDIKKENMYIIPVFIPHKGCKNECVFCNQRKISGEIRDVSEQDVKNEIEKYIKLYKDDSKKKQIAFFGGSFTGLAIEEQIKFLDVANEYILKGSVQSIRVSTRPDYIDENILKVLKTKNVETIELGVQSMDDEVLLASKRGHFKDDVVKSSKLIKNYGFKLGHQVMVGLPKSTMQKEIDTMKECIKLKPDMVRIYPVYILKDSKLYNMYENHEYKELTLDEAIKRASQMYLLCVKNRINVIRIGLQTTEEINSKNKEMKGPICDNYKERVLSYIARMNVLKRIESVDKEKTIELIVKSLEVNYVVGNSKQNLRYYQSGHSGKVLIQTIE